MTNYLFDSITGVLLCTNASPRQATEGREICPSDLAFDMETETLAIVDDVVTVVVRPQEPLDLEAVKASLRPERNRLLAASDWTQLNDTTLPEDILAAWSVYRQDLRDLTDEIDENGEVDFPEKP